jgi:hypothetical protein
MLVLFLKKITFIKKLKKKLLQDANVTSSILTLRVTAENDGAELTCRSTNPWFSSGSIEDKRVISVACK